MILLDNQTGCKFAMDGKLVTCIIPTYNRQDTIARAVDSALSQTYKPIELIVVDDGSQDETRSLLAAYGSRIQVITQQNAGPAHARNTGIKAAHGDVIAFLDSDDEWLSDKIASQVALLEDLGPEVPCVLANSLVVHPSGWKRTAFQIAGLEPRLPSGVWENVTEILIQRFVLFNQAVAIRRGALDRVGFFNERLRLLEDHDLALRLSLLGPWGFIATPKVICHAAHANSLAENSDPFAVLSLGAEVLQGLLDSNLLKESMIKRKCKRRMERLQRRAEVLNASRQSDGWRRGLSRVSWLYERVLNKLEALNRRFTPMQTRACLPSQGSATHPRAGLSQTHA